ncbi:putative indole-diterpene biosynthesis protein PaxU [Aspergillus steynii IBT 23096]|uniref:Putative indole-diterpene biosynthesis protein PaxU n=1 Tax=Aspergillus steynii IBT 23096 TaxID=1392250 RepID=A0A2I2FX63_9EURO|nr:putative indole-diterpene biosynthesis protein PaxU [Aspergillus steynii IBT 23096]PLB45230.1 putative indole-diterpene biosynthesis protein PaxU [Aspergillus steynii IBT 23096]
MSSNSRPDDALAIFTKLSPSIYISEPDANTPNGTESPTIVLAFWMNAPARALAKYVVEYKRLAPSARIVFILSSSNDFLFHHTPQARNARLSPAVQALQASLPTPESPIYLHLFSNGGVFTSTNLIAAYHQATGTQLRISSIIFDSAPGVATVPAAMRAFSFILPRFWLLRICGKALLWTFLILNHWTRKITGSSDAVSIARQAANDPLVVRGAGGKDTPPRYYIYSDADELVNWMDIEAHAAEAESKGWTVRREKFDGSPHVSHMRADPERYWGVVSEHLKSSNVV